MDVKGAYLYGTLKENIYMKQPDRHEDGTNCVCLLIKTIYGLKQSRREWNVELDTKLHLQKFTRLCADPCVYVRHRKTEIEIITAWVDNLLLFASAEQLMDSLKHKLCAEWDMTDLGEPAKIVSIEISHTENTTTISQQKYIEVILKKENMERANPVVMPMDPNLKLKPNSNGSNGNRSNLYACLLGELQFLANMTRLDIAYAVNRLSAYTANLTLQHMGVAKRILQYLVGTKMYGIMYQKIPNTDRRDNKSLPWICRRHICKYR
jgi:hypothetical protein